MNLVIAPNLACGSDVSFFRRIDTGQHSDAFAMFRVLADGDIDPVLVEHRRSVDFAGTLGCRVLEFFPFRRIAVKLPNCFEETRVALFHRFGIEGVTETVAAAEEDQLAAVDLSQRGRTPLTMENSRPDVRIIFPRQLAGFLIQRNETWSIGRRNVGVSPVL